MASSVILKTTQMFLILLCGVLVYKAGLLDSKSVRKLSDLLLLFVMPLLIFQSYQVDFDRELLYGLFRTLIASGLTYLLVIALSELIFRKKRPDTPIEKTAVVYSNCAFFGIPLINGLLGAEGVFYITAFSTMFNLFLWTHGVIVMAPASSEQSSGKSRAASMAALLRNLLTPAIFAVLAGFLCFVLQLRLPSILSEPVSMIAAMNTPLAMIIAGANLAQGNFLKSLKNRRLYLISFLKLIVFPAACLILLYALPLPFSVAFTVFIAVACPTAATTIMFADRYGHNAPYASELFVMTTLLSGITIPLLSVAAEFLLQLP